MRACEKRWRDMGGGGSSAQAGHGANPKYPCPGFLALSLCLLLGLLIFGSGSGSGSCSSDSRLKLAWRRAPERPEPQRRNRFRRLLLVFLL